MPLRPRILICSLLMATWPWPSPAQAEVRRCSGPDGSTVYTDRRCADIGGVDRLHRPGTGGSGSGGGGGGHNLYRGGCARNLQDLVYELTTAIDSGDANRLAGVYHWPGMSHRQGYAVMARLGGLVKRPLVDIAPVMPASIDGVDGDLYPQTTVRRAPVALRIEQTLSNGSTPSSSVFGLQKHFGCWWIRG